MKQIIDSETNCKGEKRNSFHPHRLISDEEYQSNMDLLITFYQMLKKDSEKRFEPIEWIKKELLAS